MTDTEVLDIVYQMFQLALKLALPLLLISMIVGIVVAIFQAATQINEQTMTFVPKLLAVLAMLGLLGSSMLRLLQDFLKMMLGIVAGG
ncbi:MAG: flagellar type III secretion system protein FliQ [Lachnospiraceae bacterium]|jgi:flagellar biosynthetic protein FliQ|nr:flagellar type III secretion system protein FliQ [Lachnospiraceae bacterium]